MGKIVLLDGGMGQELLKRSDNKTPMGWSAEYLETEPHLVQEAHADYIRAGARVITINAYSASYTRMRMIDREDRVPELQRKACEIAAAARDETGNEGADVLIAGCLPPLNGSYRPDRVRDYETNLEEYRRIAEHQAPHVDFFICETMSTSDEAMAAATAGTETGRSVWVGWTLEENDTGNIRSGEKLADGVSKLSELPIEAIIANCAPPESITAAMPALVAMGMPTGGYANGFTGVPETMMPGKTLFTLKARRDLGPEAYADYVMQWVAGGATIVGGCCEVGPAHIAHLRSELEAAGHEVVGRLN